MMQKLKSEFLQELEWRGFIAQITHPQELDELLSSKKISAYIGFDCTAKSLHVGSLIQIMILRLLKKHGHNPIVLLGGGTTKIGDPSGKDEARKILSPVQIDENLSGIKKTLAKFIDGAKFVNNDEWLSGLKYIDFLRDIGRHFSVNRMLGFDSVKSRLERDQPLSFLEFNYMILQAYDFYELYKEYDCALQIGGSDQWGNIVNGVELIRKSLNSSSFGLTSPLLTTSDGKKMGKSVNGALWLDHEMLSPYDYFQFFRNVDDLDVIRFIKLFTDLSREEIVQLEKLEGQEINKAKEILAFEATKICHGQDQAEQALEKARAIFVAGKKEAYEEKQVSFCENKKLVEIIKEIGACASNGEARRLIEGGGVKINDEKIENVDLSFVKSQNFDLQIGKKKFYRIIMVNL